jgi:hypothetical protein
MHIVEFLKECHKVLKHPAHKAEQPLHVVYFLLVGWYAGGPYGAAAFGCAIVTILAMGDEPHA